MISLPESLFDTAPPASPAAKVDELLLEPAVALLMVKTIFWLSVTAVLKVTRRLSAKVELSAQTTPVRPVKDIVAPVTVTVEPIGLVPLKSRAERMFVQLVAVKLIAVNSVP